jgi:hypothetical protein
MIRKTLGIIVGSVLASAFMSFIPGARADESDECIFKGQTLTGQERKFHSFDAEGSPCEVSPQYFQNTCH